MGSKAYSDKPCLVFRPGFVAWCVIGVGITVYELACPEGEMLSHTVDRGLEKHPWLVAGAVLVTAAHLLNQLDTPPLNHFDPYRALAGMKRLLAHT